MMDRTPAEPSPVTDLDLHDWAPAPRKAQPERIVAGLLFAGLLLFGVVRGVQSGSELMAAADFWTTFVPVNCTIAECEAYLGHATDPSKRAFKVRYTVEDNGHLVSRQTVLELPPDHPSLAASSLPFSVNQIVRGWTVPGWPDASTLETPPEFRLADGLLAVGSLALGMLGSFWWFRTRTDAGRVLDPPKEMAAGVLLFDARACLPPLKVEPGHRLPHRLRPEPPPHLQWLTWLTATVALGLSASLAAYSAARASIWNMPRGMAFLFAVLAAATGGFCLVQTVRHFQAWLRSRGLALELSFWPIRTGTPARCAFVTERRVSCSQVQLNLLREESTGLGADGEAAELVFEQVLATAERVELGHENPWDVPGEFTVPREAPHSLTGQSCSIEWRLELHLEVPGGARLVRVFPLLVIPPEALH
ncbi:MAG: hypothetical protein HY814_15195 [Candidatus Riflebacteria bacterium]|nr:hypothetical protein [Candidatus Riflebacteria bacterium]